MSLNPFTWGRKRKPKREATGPGSMGTGGPALSEAEVQEFLDGDITSVRLHGTPALAQYHEADAKLMIDYGKAAWLYGPVDRKTALAFIQAEHKQTWIWDRIRVRGEGHAHDHQMNAVQIR